MATIHVTALGHCSPQNPQERFVLIRLQAEAADQGTAPTEAPPRDISLVIDRSGSMSGHPLQVASTACAQFIGALRPIDTISVFAYDDSLETIAVRANPSELLQQKVRSLEAGGSTDLYLGWVTGAKTCQRGGQVILLSDGHANAGRWTDAHSLRKHAAVSRRQYGITTSTIGIGDGYDEALMAGMAREGGGGHYYAHTVDAVLRALDQELFSLNATIAEDVTIQFAGSSINVGRMWDGEVTDRVIAVPVPPAGLGIPDSLPGVVRWRDLETGTQAEATFSFDFSFEPNEEVSLAILTEQVQAFDEECAHVHDRSRIEGLIQRGRDLLFHVTIHPLEASAAGAALKARLNSAIEALQRLQRDFDESDASLFRKRSRQSQHNLSMPSKAFTSFDEDREVVNRLYARAAPDATEYGLCVEALQIAPLERWRSWNLAPVAKRGNTLVVLSDDPKAGFLTREVESETGHRIKTEYADRETVQRILGEVENLSEGAR